MDETQEEKTEEFVTRTHDHRMDGVTSLVATLIEKFVDQEIPYADWPYIIARARGILNEKVKEVNFSNEMIHEARMNFLRSNLEKLRNVVVEPVANPDERVERCEDICQFLVAETLKDELVLSDVAYYEEGIAEDDSLLATLGVKGYLNAADEAVGICTDNNLTRVFDELWGKVREDRTWTDMDTTLKFLPEDKK